MVQERVTTINNRLLTIICHRDLRILHEENRERRKRARAGPRGVAVDVAQRKAVRLAAIFALALGQNAFEAAYTLKLSDNFLLADALGNLPLRVEGKVDVLGRVQPRRTPCKALEYDENRQRRGAQRAAQVDQVQGKMPAQTAVDDSEDAHVAVFDSYISGSSPINRFDARISFGTQEARHNASIPFLQRVARVSE